MDINVIDAILVGVPNGPNYWMVSTEVVEDNGARYKQAHRFPEDIFEHRAAEHGIVDTDQLIEIVLYETHAPAKSFDEAIDTDSMLERIKARKNGGKIATRNRYPHEGSSTIVAHPNTILVDAYLDLLLPLDVLKREMLLDFEHIEVKRTIHRRRVAVHREMRSAPSRDYRERPTPAEMLDRTVRQHPAITGPPAETILGRSMNNELQ